MPHIFIYFYLTKYIRTTNYYLFSSFFYVENKFITLSNCYNSKISRLWQSVDQDDRKCNTGTFVLVYHHNIVLNIALFNNNIQPKLRDITWYIIFNIVYFKICFPFSQLQNYGGILPLPTTKRKITFLPRGRIDFSICFGCFRFCRC